MTLTAQQQLGFVHGTIVDPRGAVIPGARVNVSAKEGTCETRSDVAGKFNCQLPPGRYSVVATSTGFFPYRRAAIDLKASAHVFLKLHTVPGPMRGISVGTPFPEEPDPTTYEDHTVAGADIGIRYSSVENKEAETIFHGPYLMLTIDTFSIYAEEISCSTAMRTCTAKGAVTAEVGAEALQGTQAVIDLMNRQVTVTREPLVIRTF